MNDDKHVVVGRKYTTKKYWYAKTVTNDRIEQARDYSTFVFYAERQEGRMRNGRYLGNPLCVWLSGFEAGARRSGASASPQ
ncbi:hypothetical protein [Cupriavidus sp. UYPR2.512]|uniref:hypothetical protein n=1 Tax=Cupriavidus sp. UYPR2.512 TaxID=1080187 RepID=UPI0012F72DE5|nr:hypothetical protein [Cupriavidus sp. UYPR2.512]UIF89873.1 hypothetical protein KAF44_39495 [Cupriavidus necator]